MRIKVEIPRKKAQEIVGDVMLKQFFAQPNGLRVQSVEWDTYRTTVEVVVTDEPEEAT
jgi:hypothetical protein